jgi:hypothetical protein
MDVNIEWCHIWSMHVLLKYFNISMSFFEQEKLMVIIMCFKYMQILEARIQLGFLSSFFPIFDIKKLTKVNKLH